MGTQPEQILEENLVKQLVELGYEKAIIRDEKDLLKNLRIQLEKHNKKSISEKEFAQVLNQLNKGNIFGKAKILRDRVSYINDNGEKTTLELINNVHWCKNEFQVCHQVSMEGTYKNRYDVTILINGLPLVQIELKRRGIELKEAFNQTNRYERESYASGAGLFNYIQIFVISNGVNTKYYCNNSIRARSFKQTFYWADVNNKLITQLNKFAEVFLEPCHISKMITRYIVLSESLKCLMVLRPYQYYASEAIVEKVQNRSGNGYIWHTTGSGKTLTSFKASQIITNLPKVYKVVFVVDRKDLDYQTGKEFNSFSKGSIDGTSDTKSLVKQLSDETNLIVTTIQKLNSAIIKSRYLYKMGGLKDKRIVFIFDECHRSQFGKTHDTIKNFFTNCQMFGFTGTPIFEENSSRNLFGKRTTKMLFDECLHKYIITDAIRDENVLKFSVEYIRTFKKKDEIVDINVEAIDEAEVMNSPTRLNNIVDYIIANHDRKTHNRKFNSIFCISSIPNLIEYYNIFHEKELKGEHNLKFATIFSYKANEEDKDAIGMFDEEDLMLAAEEKVEYNTKHSREQLDEYISIYNKQFGTNFSTKDSKSFYNYYNNVSDKLKEKEIDILLVVNMFLTGFDSRTLNTIYVDKNLKQHGLIQAFSRTNRILNEQKSQGNVVCFRNLKEATDKAVALFSKRDAKEDIIIEPYEEYVKKFNEALIELLQIAPSPDSVNSLQSEEDELVFVKSFRELMRLRNVLCTFTEYDASNLSMSEQSFADYSSKYQDLRDKVKSMHQKEKASILNDIDFELELIHRDEINVAYILKLLVVLKDSKPEEHEKQKKVILDMLTSEVQLRSKRELIEKFIEFNFPHIEDSDNIEEEYDIYLQKEREKDFNKLVEGENLNSERLQKLISNYIFTNKKPLRDDLVGTLEVRPRLIERKKISENLLHKIKSFLEKYDMI